MKPKVSVQGRDILVVSSVEAVEKCPNHNLSHPKS